MFVPDRGAVALQLAPALPVVMATLVQSGPVAASLSATPATPAAMSSKFGASEMRLDLLDPCVPLEYPVNVYSDVFDRRQAVQYNKLAGLLETAAWSEALQFIGSLSVAFLKDL